MKLRAIQVFKRLKPEDFKMLALLERWSRRYEYIPLEKIPTLEGVDPKQAGFLLGRLNRLKLVERRRAEYVGYKLLSSGYDALALRALVERGVVEAFGTPLGIGKEADVYDALSPEGEKLVVKFHRLGRTSFTRVTRLRPYPAGLGWIQASQAAASREFKALQRLYPRVSVPKPLAQDRHVLAMGFIDGVELANVEEILNPKAVLEDVLLNLGRAVELGVIHADLSEHNVVIKPDGGVLLIDWPQWVPPDHPQARELLERDVGNLLKFFKRKFRIELELSEALDLVGATRLGSP